MTTSAHPVLSLAKPPPAATLPPASLEQRIAAIRAEIDAIVDARAASVLRENPGIPLQVVRNLLTARAGACQCEQYLQLGADGAS